MVEIAAVVAAPVAITVALTVNAIGTAPCIRLAKSRPAVGVGKIPVVVSAPVPVIARTAPVVLCVINTMM